jgi:flagellar motor protein MotB
VVESIDLVGHADRLNSTGSGDYNQRLSEKRVATVRDELVRMIADWEKELERAIRQCFETKEGHFCKRRWFWRG